MLKRLNSVLAFLLVVNLSAACSDAETYVYSYPHVHIFFGGANTNDTVEVHYRGALDYGEEFDSTSSLPYRWRRLLRLGVELAFGTPAGTGGRNSGGASGAIEPR